MVGGRKGCGHCAGGISPRLNDQLNALHLALPPEVIQDRIRSVTIQGYWKNIELEMPRGREMVSVFRMSRSGSNPNRQHNFDALLLEYAVREGAELVSGDVYATERSAQNKPVVKYRDAVGEHASEVDFLVFAAGINAEVDKGNPGPSPVQLMQHLNPRYLPPQCRRTLVFELEAEAGTSSGLEGELHFVEYGSSSLRLEMCSLVPKKDCITVVLVGPAVDTATTNAQNRELIEQFLALPHIHKLLAARHHFRVTCICNPWLAVGTAHHAFGDRVAAVGDMVTSRLYKDGILSAFKTSQALAEALLTWGMDQRSLDEAYAPVIRNFRRDNRFAAIVFLLNRVFFESAILSRVLYQAVITERKTMPISERSLAIILWQIASGDEDYEHVFWALLRPSTLWLVLTGGLLVTVRNYLTEFFFGLSWEGFGRFTTGVAKERFEVKRRMFARKLAGEGPVPSGFEFERMYTISIRATPASVLSQLGRFGEADRGYLRPRWVSIQRVAGQPNEPGCVIRYTILGGVFAFDLGLEQILDNHLVVYRVRNGFACGGALLFEVEPTVRNTNLSLYVAFDFERGTSLPQRVWWWLFRLLFPAYVHDVIWNHALCQLKDITEATDEAPSSPAK